jgi:hypothetical protein
VTAKPDRDRGVFYRSANAATAIVHVRINRPTTFRQLGRLNPNATVIVAPPEIRPTTRHPTFACGANSAIATIDPPATIVIAVANCLIA